MNYELVHNRLMKIVNESYDRITIIEGGYYGADDCANRFCKDNPDLVDHLQFKADWKQFKNAAGPIRNRKMLNEGKPNRVLAFTNDLRRSKGTLDMITIARAKDVPVEIIGLDQLQR